METFSPKEKNDMASASPVQIVISKDLTIPRIILPAVKRARERAGHSNIYYPSVVSIGPYHHGKQELYRAEIVKQQILESFISEGNGRDKTFFYYKIFKKISEVRACYEEVHFTDNMLAEIILLDACFLIHYLKHVRAQHVNDKTYQCLNHYFGRRGMKFVGCDILMLENQIPLWVIKLLYCCHPYEQECSWDELFHNFLKESHVYLDAHIDKDKIINESFHFLQAIRSVEKVNVRDAITITHNNIFTRFVTPKVVDDDIELPIVQKADLRFRSITSLRTKGIVIKPVNKQEICFSSYLLYGKLEIPVICLQFDSFTKYSNIIAYDMSRVQHGDTKVTAYLNLLKSLIESPSDVKELRESGILLNFLDNDEKVVNLFKDLDCAGHYEGVYFGLKASIKKHCSSITKTWKAELINTYFRSPLTAFALLAAICLTVLTFVQTYLTIYPVN